MATKSKVRIRIFRRRARCGFVSFTVRLAFSLPKGFGAGRWCRSKETSTSRSSVSVPSSMSTSYPVFARTRVCTFGWIWNFRIVCRRRALAGNTGCQIRSFRSSGIAWLCPETVQPYELKSSSSLACQGWTQFLRFRSNLALLPHLVAKGFDAMRPTSTGSRR